MGVTLGDLSVAARGKSPWTGGYHFKVKDNPYLGEGWEKDDWATFEAAAAGGKDYLVGERLTMPEYLKKHSSALTGWLQLAYRWAQENPTQMLVADNRTSREYHIVKRGDHVEISLPHQDMGGEKAWISRDGRTRLLINED